jgi:hypothetical protein
LHGATGYWSALFAGCNLLLAYSSPNTAMEAMTNTFNPMVSLQLTCGLSIGLGANIE